MEMYFGVDPSPRPESKSDETDILLDGEGKLRMASAQSYGFSSDQQFTDFCKLLETKQFVTDTQFIAFRNMLERGKNNVNQVLEQATDITNFLVLGNCADSLESTIPIADRNRKIEAFKKHGYTHVINLAAKDIRPLRDATGKLEYENINVKYYPFENASDGEGYDILQHFSEVQKIINTARDTNGKVLIHCQGGVHRTGALAIAYFVQEKLGEIVTGEDSQPVGVSLYESADFIRR